MQIYDTGFSALIKADMTAFSSSMSAIREYNQMAVLCKPENKPLLDNKADSTLGLSFLDRC